MCVVTTLNSVFNQESTPQGQSTNSSFHRIYSDCDEDLSQHSDGETTIFSDSYSSVHRSRKCDSILNNSFSSAKTSPTGYKTMPSMNSAPSLNHSFRSEFQQSPCYQKSSHDSFKPHNHPHNNTDRLEFFPNKPIDETLRCSSMFGLNSSFRIPDDCQTKLTDLNISGTRRRTNNTINCSSPTPSLISMNRCRSQLLLTPARLNFNGHSPLTAPVTQTSWVAGGFFGKNSMSPQKRQQQPQSVLLHPILSRTSSQSSGFESQASSAQNGNPNGSRESSIAGDVVSNFSEPTLIADSASQMGINCDANSMFASALPRPKPFLPVPNQSQFIDSASCKPESFTNYSTFPWTNHTGNNNLTSPSLSSQPVYHQFGTHRHSFYNNDSVFNRFSQHSPAIRKGNLLKPLTDNSYNFDNK